ncbi:MAG: thiopurine S-methyltransferase, partial [Pseudomonadota bacterium]
MEHDFWHDRWQSNQLGFHQEATNARLMAFWPRLNLAEDST